MTIWPAPSASMFSISFAWVERGHGQLPIWLQARIVDLDQDDVAADRMAADLVAADAQAVLQQFAEADQAEEDRGQQRPQQQLQALVLAVGGFVSGAAGRIASPNGQWPPRPPMRVQRLKTRKPRCD